MPKFCSAPFDTITITPNGNVASCFCPGWHNYPTSMGNLTTDSLQDIFVNSNFQTFRDSIKDQSFKYCIKDRCYKMWNLDTVADVESAIRLPHLPTTLNVQIEKRCNLKCASCRNDIIWSKEADPIVEEILNKLTDAYQDFDQPVWFQCDLIGDVFASTAYQNFFKNKKFPKCFQLHLSTNGTLVTKNLDILEGIKDQIASIIFSIDAATEETYKQVRGAKLSTVIDGINACKQINVLRINTSFVVQKQNYLEILDFYNLCKSLEVNHITFLIMHKQFHMTNSWWQTNQINNNPTVDYNFLIPALEQLKQYPTVDICGGLENLINQHQNV